MTVTIEKDLAIRNQRGGANPLKIKNIHNVEFWCGNARQTSYFYRKAFGFSQLAYSGLETGNRETASYVLWQGKIRFVCGNGDVALNTGIRIQQLQRDYYQCWQGLRKNFRPDQG